MNITNYGRDLRKCSVVNIEDMLTDMYLICNCLKVNGLTLTTDSVLLFTLVINIGYVVQVGIHMRSKI